MTANIEGWSQAGLDYELEDGIAWLRLNRPEKRNAIDRPLRNALLDAIHEVSEDPAVRAAVITGNGKAFSSGADLTQEGGANEIPPDRLLEGGPGRLEDGLLYGWGRLMDAIWRSSKVFIAGVNGVAAGGGCQLALGCDLIIASEEASFWEIFVQRGLPLEGGAAWILPRLVSLPKAKEIALYGQPLPARTAEEWGMINACVPAEDLEATVRDWARRLADGPTIRIGHIKGQMNNGVEASMKQVFRDEVFLLGVGGGEDSMEAFRAYAEKRDPKFTGR